jgi:putative membrane protein
MMPGFGYGGGLQIIEIIWIVLIAAFWILILVGLFFGVRWLIRADRNSRLPGPPPPQGTAPGWGPGPRPDDPLEILRQRYARGEIDDEEYERRRRTLSGG